MSCVRPVIKLDLLIKSFVEPAAAKKLLEILNNKCLFGNLIECGNFLVENNMQFIFWKFLIIIQLQTHVGKIVEETFARETFVNFWAD